MASFGSLPSEILHNIVSQLSPNTSHQFSGFARSSPNFADLRNCTLVCQTLWDVASSALYRHIDLNFDELCYGQAKEETYRRQSRLLRSLAENAMLGALVHTFKNHRIPTPTASRSPLDATFDEDASIVTKAAGNMKNLAVAFLTPNPLAAHIIANLSSYLALHDLHIYGFKPTEFIWENAFISLKTLKWEEPILGRFAVPEQNAWDTAQFLMNIAEATCPNLESLEVYPIDMRLPLPSLAVVPQERVDDYRQLNMGSATRLTNLRYFALGACNNTSLDLPFHDLKDSRCRLLTSVAIPISFGPWLREDLDFIVQVANNLPHLRDLDLVRTRYCHNKELMDANEFFHILTTALDNPKCSIERFSVEDIRTSFSPTIGALFGRWTSLRVLSLGAFDDGRESNNPYVSDEKIDFRKHRSAILGMINSLPPSLEELYLEINGYDLLCHDDSDFDPLCNLGTTIFDRLRRLHTCDVHAWISAIGGGIGLTPEKGVFYRRLKHEPRPGDEDIPANKVKDIWTSRMDCIYPDDDRTVSAVLVEVQLEDHEGVWEGNDAKGVWCDGFVFQRSQEDASREHPADYVDHSWPLWEDKVASYPMFRSRKM